MTMTEQDVALVFLLDADLRGEQELRRLRIEVDHLRLVAGALDKVERALGPGHLPASIDRVVVLPRPAAECVAPEHNARRCGACGQAGHHRKTCERRRAAARARG